MKFSYLPVPLGFFSQWIISKVIHPFEGSSVMWGCQYHLLTLNGLKPQSPSRVNVKANNLPKTSSVSAYLLTILTAISLLLLAPGACPDCLMNSFQWVFIAFWPMFRDGLSWEDDWNYFICHIARKGTRFHFSCLMSSIANAFFLRVLWHLRFQNNFSSE